MTKQINIPQSNPKFRQVKASWRDRSVALAAIVTVLLVLSIIVGALWWAALEIWQSALSNI